MTRESKSEQSLALRVIVLIIALQTTFLTYSLVGDPGSAGITIAISVPRGDRYPDGTSCPRGPQLIGSERKSSTPTNGKGKY